MERPKHGQPMGLYDQLLHVLYKKLTAVREVVFLKDPIQKLKFHQPKFIKLLLNYLLNGPHKTTGVLKISKRYSSYKSPAKRFTLVLNYPPNGPD